MQHATMIPLDLLCRSEFNVRKTATDEGIAELAASIERDDLLQNLTVIQQPGTKMHAVVAGGRRLAALNLLAKQGKIPTNHPVPCRVIEEGSAEAVSLAENQLREAMHPADQFEAFKARVDAGEPIADVAARFGVTETFVRQRLRLCEVAPVLIEAFREGEMTLETLQAFTVCNDHGRQIGVWNQFKRQGDGPYLARIIKGALRREEMDSTHVLVKFVGLKAYEKAGGKTTTDLFAEDDDAPATLSDPGLIEQLATEKLEKQAAKVKKAEGLAWCEARLEFGYYDREKFGKVPTLRAEMTQEQAKEYAALEATIEAKQKELDALREEDDFDEVKESELCGDLEDAEARRDAIDESLVQPDPDALQYAGAVVTVNGRGKAEIHRNLIRKEDMKHLKPKKPEAKPGTDAGSDAQDAGPKAAHSMALIRQLTAIKTAILRDRMARHVSGRAALEVMVYHLLSEDLRDEMTEGGCLTMTTREMGIEGDAPYLEDSDLCMATKDHADALLDPIRAMMAEVRYGEHDWALLQYLAKTSEDQLLALLAVCVAKRLHLVTASEHGGGKSDTVARYLLNDEIVASCWKPTVDSYLGSVSKPVVIAAVTEACGEEAARPLVSMKKADAAAKAEELLAGTGWLPSPLRTERAQ